MHVFFFCLCVCCNDYNLATFLIFKLLNIAKTEIILANYLQSKVNAFAL